MLKSFYVSISLVDLAQAIGTWILILEAFPCLVHLYRYSRFPHPVVHSPASFLERRRETSSHLGYWDVRLSKM
ncbi:hypothetical protein F5Y19DRAFT_268065 [Xylariaceae sp. FL1651]|nr:hypothetical protein F5Y19DRAFT_268065 [Xylariaceae sp. FL1651]